MMWKTLFLASVGLVAAEDGLDGWLRYARLPDSKSAAAVGTLPSSVVGLNATENGPISSALSELQKGYQGIFGRDVTPGKDACAASSIVVATLDQYVAECGDEGVEEADLSEDGFWLSVKGDSVKILGQNERGALYGAFEYLSLLAQANFTEVAYATNPSAKIRWANQWDNMDGTGTHGSIERGVSCLLRPLSTHGLRSQTDLVLVWWCFHLLREPQGRHRHDPRLPVRPPAGLGQDQRNHHQ